LTKAVAFGLPTKAGSTAGQGGSNVSFPGECHLSCLLFVNLPFGGLTDAGEADRGCSPVFKRAIPDAAIAPPNRQLAVPRAD
jgi:hypothetical protein